MIEKISLVIVGLGLLLLSGQSGLAADRYVVPPGTAGVIPGSPYNTWTNAATNISTAISGASAPGTIWVSNGTYFRQTISVSTGITVRSLPEYGAAQTIIDGGYPDYSNRPVYINFADAVVDGFTVTRGYVPSGGGGGVYIAGAGGTIQNCIIISNSVGGDGGAGAFLYGSAGAAYVRNCTVIQNTAANAGGVETRATNCYILDSTIISNTASSSIAGIWFRDVQPVMVSNCDIMFNESAGSGGGAGGSPPPIFNSRIVGNRAMGGYGGGGYNLLLEDCVVASNYCLTFGGGLYAGRANRCTFDANSAGNNGGAIYNNSLVSNSIIRNNVAATNGGGAYLSSVGVLENCRIYNNLASNGGGGVYFSEGGTQMNCLVYNNSANYGGGLYIYRFRNGNGMLASCTIVSNYAATSGGGAYLNTSTSYISGSIFCSNAAGASAADIYLLSTSYTNAFDYCCAPTNVFAPNRGNMTNDPLFNNPAAGNYRLVAGSPCINAGTNQSWMTNSLDLDNRIRIRYGTVDIGCYECVFPGMMFSAH